MSDQDPILAEIARVCLETRLLIEASTLPIDASTTTVMMSAFLLMAKHHGVSKEEVMASLGNLWDLA